MFYAKLITFGLALAFSFILIEDVIEQILLQLKKDYEALHLEYTHGLSSLVNTTLLIIVCTLWATFYGLNIV